MPYFEQDDIAQIGTPPANAHVGVIRISGPGAFRILAGTTSGLEGLLPEPARRFIRDCRFLLPLKTGTGGKARLQSRVFPCPARAMAMPAPASYTTEDVAEIHLPGSLPILKAALGAIIRAGARAAEPGEFTFRAFRGGRLTLRQAEAVEEVIRADSDAEKRRALSRLGDARQRRIEEWRDRLLDCAARVEAALDFSEEELEGDAAAGIADIARELDAAAAGIADNGNGCSNGGGDTADSVPGVALVGLANAGKSSLMNALVEDDAVIVSPRPSTTRDSIRREVFWHGTRFVLSDNPGYDRRSGGAGSAAAARAADRLAAHDLAVWVVDSSAAPDAELEAFAALLSGGVAIALNKTDRPARVDERTILEIADRHGLAVQAVRPVSAATGAGIPELRKCLAGAAARLRVAGPWNRREIWELSAAGECCRDAVRELSGAGRLELAAEDLRRAAGAFARALGEGYAEETLARIFSRFCIGK